MVDEAEHAASVGLHFHSRGSSESVASSSSTRTWGGSHGEGSNLGKPNSEEKKKNHETTESTQVSRTNPSPDRSSNANVEKEN